MADAVPNPIDLEAAAAAAGPAEPHLPGADPAGDPPAPLPGVPAGADPLTTFWLLFDAWMLEWSPTTLKLKLALRHLQLSTVESRSKPQS